MKSPDRGMMKWAPYKSLVEQADALTTAKKLKEKQPKPLMSSDIAEEINRILTTYHKQEVSITFWKDGYFYKEIGIISSIDSTFKQLRINKKLISFDSLVLLEETSPDEFSNSI